MTLGLAPGPVSATDPSPVDAAARLAYSWRVTKAGAPVDLTGVPTTGTGFAYTPTEPGTYTVTVRVADKDGG